MPSFSSRIAMMDGSQQDQKRRRKIGKGACYQCGEGGHRARDCPDAPPEARDGLKAADRDPPPDRGCFAAAGVGDATTSPGGFTYVELFAGMGGFRVALDRLGGRCVFASEVDRFCVKNYEANFGGDRPAGDVCKVPSDWIPDHDLLVGGFPCQPFSGSGSRGGMDDVRGVLFREIARVLRDKRPRAFLLENVRGLLLHEDGRTFTIIRTELEDCGYVLYWELVDAVALLPQERKRLYIVGVRRDLDASGCKYKFPTFPSLGRGVKDILQYTESDALSEEDIESLALTPHQLSKVRSQSYTKKFPEARFLCDLSLPSKTLQSSYSSYMVGSQFVPANADESSVTKGLTASHENEMLKWRRFSPREAARLQGFPESFALCSQRAYHMIGNAVAPPVIAMVTGPLLKSLGLLSCDQSAQDWGWIVTREILLEAAPSDHRMTELKDKLASHP